MQPKSRFQELTLDFRRDELRISAVPEVELARMLGSAQGNRMSIPLPDILSHVVRIARGAGEIILRHFAAPIPTTSKTTRSDVVTAADTEPEGYIVGELLKTYPTHHIVGEEGGGQSASPGCAPSRHPCLGKTILSEGA